VELRLLLLQNKNYSKINDNCSEGSRKKQDITNNQLHLCADEISGKKIKIKRH